MSEIQSRLDKLTDAQKELLLKLAREKRASKTPPKSEEIKPSKEQGFLSAQQHALWMFQELHPNSTAYNENCVVRINGRLNQDAFAYALNRLVYRNDILRTRYIVDADGVRSVVDTFSNYEIETIDLRELETAAKQAATKGFQKERAAKCFNLSGEHSFRFTLYRLEETLSELHIVNHHIASDGWTKSLLVRELLEGYEQGICGDKLDTGEKPAIQYGDYAAWQKKRREEGAWESLMGLWDEAWKDGVPDSEFPYDGQRSEIGEGQLSSFELLFSIEEQRTLRAAARSYKCTLNELCLTAYATLLVRYSHSEKVVIGTPAANRLQEETQKMLGFFVNVLPLPLEIKSDHTITECLSEVRRCNAKALISQEVGFDHLVERFGKERVAGRNPLFDAFFVFQNIAKTELKAAGLELEVLEEEAKVAKYDLTLFIVDDRTSLSGKLQFRSDLFSIPFATGIASVYKETLLAFAENVHASTPLELTIPQDQKASLQHWNSTDAHLPDDSTVLSGLRKTVSNYPDKIALRWDSGTLSYQELDDISTRLANYLATDCEVSVGDVVGLEFSRSPEMLASILGVLKAGAAYLPIDPLQSKERKQYLLKDANVSVVLGNQDSEYEAFEGCFFTPVSLEWLQTLERKSETNSRTAGQSDLAYVIYTSGSTGTPKGVMVEHGSVVNMLRWMERQYAIGSDDVLLQKTNYTFDVSVWELLLPGICGAELVLLPIGGEREPSVLERYIQEYGVSTVHFGPAMLAEFLNWLPSSTKFPALKRVFVGGEHLSLGLKQKWFSTLGSEVELFNQYGPTEATIDVTFQKIEAEQERVTIGKPISNTKIHVVSDGGYELPVGAIGELCISGNCLARGYLNADSLTNERFAIHALVDGKRLYRSGDLARLLPNGSIELIGRKSEGQVKLRGYRIELGEIEAALMSLDGVTQSVAALQGEDGVKALVAFYVSENGEEISAIQDKLGVLLPPYMMPQSIARIDRVPLLSSGKVNRAALPIVREGNVNSSDESVPPRNPDEAKMFEIWKTVLGVSNFGIRDSFFRLGGHSLKAIQVVSRVRRKWECDIPVSSVFEHPTVEALVRFLETAKHGLRLQVPKSERRNSYPASSQQRRLYALQQLEPESLVYNMPTAYRFEGKLDRGRLEATVRALAERHPILATRFSMRDGQLISERIQEKKLTVENIHCTESEIGNTCRSLVQPFDLEEGPLIRFSHLSVEEGGSILFVDMHHIISDGTSTEILARDFAILYYNRNLAEVDRDYFDYSVWQQEAEGKELLEQQKAYWQQQFRELPTNVTLPEDRSRAQMRSSEGGSLEVCLNQADSNAFREFCSANEVSLYIAVLAAYSSLLGRLAGSEDIVVGNAVSGRDLEGFDHAIGMFVNTLAMRTQPRRDMRFVDYLRETKATTLQALENQQYPFEELVESLKIKRDTSRSPLFDTMLVVQNFAANDASVSDGLCEKLRIGFQVAKFDLLIFVSEEQGEIRLKVDYSKQLYFEDTISRFANRLTRWMSAVALSAEKQIADIDLFLPLEREEVLDGFNKSQRAYVRGETLHGIFESSVQFYPENKALVGDEGQWTYRELNERANQVAHYLKNKLGAGPEKIVGIAMHRSFEMVATILGILKSGAAYLPIDPSHPEKRVSYLIEDSRAIAVIADESWKNGAELEVPVLRASSYALGESTENIDLEIGAQSLAYVIYTSGSTGKPKGVEIEHASIVNTLNYLQEEYPLIGDDAYLLKTNYTFDVSVSELFGWYYAGGRLAILAPGSEKEPSDIAAAIERYGATHINFVPSMLGAFLESLPKNKLSQLRTLKHVIVAGEAFPGSLFQSYRNSGIEASLENIYGPTETSIYATRYRMAEYSGEGLVSIGEPVANTQAYVLDEYDKPLPVGVVGELCIGGKGLARGYLNRPKLTAERFCRNPFADGERMYRTGDLARWRDNGTIEFLGRIDGQVKVRGYRIELGEIETCLHEHAAIKEAVVVAQQNAGASVLIGYYQSEGNLSPTDLKEHLSKRLPGYMVPQLYVGLESFPRTTSGKIDRKALPSLALDGLSQSEYRAPKTEVETAVAGAWKMVLGIDRVGLDDDYFDLGGDSIKSIQIVSRLRQDGLRLKVADLFAHSRLADLCSVVEVEASKNVEEDLEETAEFTPMMHWFLDTPMPERDHWNQSILLKSQLPIDLEAMQSAIDAVVNHHDALNLRLDSAERVLRYVDPKASKVELECIELNSEDDEATQIERFAGQAQAGLSLQTGPIFRAIVFKGRSTDYLFIVIHHMMVDGVSWRVLLEDIGMAYDATRQAKDISLPEKSTSFGRWTRLLKEAYQNNVYATELAYWQAIDSRDQVDLFSSENDKSFKVADKTLTRIELDEITTKSLLGSSNRAFNTRTNDLLLAALEKALSETVKTNGELIVNLEGHGRYSIGGVDVDLGRSVGWFTNQYPVTLDLKSKIPDSRRIASVKERLRQVPYDGMGYGILKHLGGSVSPLQAKPRISFNYLGNFDQDLARSGFEASHYSKGDNQGANNPLVYDLDINGLVVAGKLSFAIGYAKTDDRTAFVETFAKRFQEALFAINEACESETNPQTTPSDLGAGWLSLDDWELLQERESVKSLSVVNIRRLTPMQLGILYHDAAERGSGSYVIQTLLEIDGEIDPELTREAFESVLNRHEALRSRFVAGVGEEPIQILCESDGSAYEFSDWQDLSSDDQILNIETLLESDRQSGFSLERENPFRLHLIRCDEKRSYLYLANHHIVMDGWCMPILLKEFLAAYDPTKRSALPKQQRRYTEYLDWFFAQDLEKDFEYWQNQLAGFETASRIPFKQESKDTQAYRNERFLVPLTNDLSTSALELARTLKATPNSVAQAIWAILLQRFNNSEDVVFGNVTSGRPPEIEGIDSVVGLFMNTIPLRVNSGGDVTFDSIVSQIQRDFRASERHGNLSLADIQTRMGSGIELLDHVFVFENFPVDEALKDGTAAANLPFRVSNVERREQTNFDFNIVLYVQDGGLKVRFDYNANLYKRADIERIGRHFATVLEQVVHAPQCKVGSISIVDEAEARLLLKDFQGEKVNYPLELCLHRFLEAQVPVNSERIAVVDTKGAYSFEDLNAQANRIAHRLRAEALIATDAIVGIIAERSFEMIAGIWGILKAGAAYLPIDPGYPQERIDFILEDSSSVAVLSQSKFVSRANTGPARPVIDLDDPSSFDGFSCENLEHEENSRQLAYVIYTSGSTGTPKGVMLEHAGAINRLLWMRDAYEIGAADVVLQKTVYTFDVSVWELLLPGMCGAKQVFLEPKAESDPAKIEAAIEEEDVTLMHFVPSMLTAFLHWFVDTKAFPSLRHVICSGEALTPAHVKLWTQKIAGGAKLHNLYGPTEASIDVTRFEVPASARIVPIGTCVENTELHIFDRFGQLCPVGVAGELCIGGVQLARGYLNREDLTNEKFVAHPQNPETRVYRTGDLTRWLPDGTIEYLDRIDNQVKLRGFRIELGEIEAALLEVSAIREAVAIVKEIHGDKAIVAYYSVEESIEESSLRRALESRLPHYMVPSYFVLMEQIPLSSSGKANRKALPEPSQNRLVNRYYAAAETEIEVELVKDWERLLHATHVGIDDDFYELGGHSIKAVQLLARVNHRYSCTLNVSDLYENPTIRAFSKLIESQSEASGTGVAGAWESGMSLLKSFASKLTSVELEDPSSYYPMTPIEMGMIYSSQLAPEQPIYYDQFVFQFESDAIEKVASAFRALVQKHEILRTRYFTKRYDEPCKKVEAELSDLPIFSYDLREKDEEQQLSFIHERQSEISKERFAFDGEVLWRIHYFQCDANRFVGILACHHSVLDGWSVNRLMHELSLMVEGKGDSTEQSLKATYRDYCAIQLRKQTSEEARVFWKEQLNGCSRNKLPFNYTGKRLRESVGMKMVKRYPEADLLNELKTFAQAERVSLKAVFIAAHVYLTHVVNGEDDIVTGVVSHDRPAIPDGEKILGCFLSTLPLRVQLGKQLSPRSIVQQVHTFLVQASRHEMHLTDVAQIVGSESGGSNPFFDCLLNFTDFAVGETRLGSEGLRSSSEDRFAGQLVGEEMTNTLFDLEIDKTFDRLSLRIKYSPSYFEDEDVSQALALYQRILELFASDATTILNPQALLSAEEYAYLAHRFNDTVAPFSKEMSMHCLFESQVERDPSAIALRQDGKTLSYGSLNVLANRLAHTLIESGVKPGDSVGLFSERNFSMIVGMLGILKAGGAYVPIDPSYPAERQKFILENSGASLAVCDESVSLANELTAGEMRILQIDTKAPKEGEFANPEIEIAPDQVAYTIYTSGSTGRPKGVMIEHQSAVNLIEWVNTRFDVTPRDRLLFVSSMCFDLSVYDIFGMLAVGGSLVIATLDQVREFKELKRIISEEGVTFWDSVPTTMDYLVRELEYEQSGFTQNELRVVFMSGDWIPVELPNRLRSFFPNAKPISLGGATEGTVWSNYFPIEKVETKWSSIPYGIPITNNFFYVTNDDGEMLPRGAVGELCIGGIGVAVGYANDAEKTDAAFVTDPFRKELGGRMYRTGDLGRITCEGQMEFLGRKDHQVKVRGYRVELGEIESVLLRREDVSGSVVDARRDSNGNNFLVAYVVSNRPIESETLTRYVAESLPFYMVPSRIVFIENIPLTANGKINRKALPDPSAIDEQTVKARTLSRNEIDDALIDIWKEVLSLEEVGIDDNFFEIGGHSLSAVSTVSRVTKRFAVELNLRDMFTQPTIRMMSDQIQTMQNIDALRGADEEDYELI